MIYVSMTHPMAYMYQWSSFAFALSVNPLQISRIPRDCSISGTTKYTDWCPAEGLWLFVALNYIVFRYNNYILQCVPLCLYVRECVCVCVCGCVYVCVSLLLCVCDSLCFCFFLCECLCVVSVDIIIISIQCTALWDVLFRYCYQVD